MVASDPARRDPFGLDPEESALLASLFVEAAADLGLDGARIYAALRAGQTLGAALGLPESVVEVLYARAHTWFAAGRSDRAEPLFRVLCALDGACADHWVGHGVCLHLRGADSEATIAFATAAALRPDWAVPHFHAAGLAVAQGGWDRAAEHLFAFRERQDRDTPEALVREAGRLAAALAQRGDRTVADRERA